MEKERSRDMVIDEAYKNSTLIEKTEEKASINKCIEHMYFVLINK